MFKKTTLLAVVVIAATALSASGASAANPMITDGLGNGLKTVTATSQNTVATSGTISIKCTTVNMEITLENNTNTTANGGIVGTATGRPSIPSHTGPCELLPAGIKVDFNFLTGVIHVDGGAGGTNTANFAYAYTITHPTLGNIPCQDVVVANVTYTNATDKIKISGATTGVENIPPCPAKGNVVGDFTLTDAEEQPAFIG
jgi:hypothetical protein